MSFFRAPAWAQPQPAKAEDDDNEEDLFSHKGSFMSMFKDQSERQKKEKEREERRKAKTEGKRKSSEKRDSEEPAGKSEFKKRRITSEESSKLLAKAGLTNVIDLSDGEDEPVEESLPVRRSPRNNRTKDVFNPACRKGKLTVPIDGGNISEDDFDITAVKAPPRPPPPEPEEELDSDPEIAEMQREARAKARKQRESVPAASPGSKGTPVASSSTPSAIDPVVKILVTSKIPGTKALILCRKLSQRLREVREMWCKKQGFSDERMAEVFFVHRGRQYWDSTTVRRLGLEADGDGRIYRTDNRSQEGVDQVHVEAVTQEMFDKMKAEKARKAKAGLSVYEEEEEEQADEGAEEAPAKPKEIRLTVKAKDKPDWKVIVKPTTSIATIMKKGKMNLGFANDQDVYLEFDGDRLEPDQTVADTEIEDMYCIDMHEA